MEQFLVLLGNHLFEVMGLFVLLALTMRYVAFRHSRKDTLYYSSFARELDKKIQEDSANKVLIENPMDYLSNLLTEVNQKLPKRSIRSGKRKQKKAAKKAAKDGSVSLRDYVGGQDSLIHGLQDDGKTFMSKYPPNYSSLTERLMSQDDHWTKLYNIIPIDTMSRMIDVLPGILIVMGVFGTFIGISQALPEVTRIDFNNVEGSSEVLSEFVLKVTYAMDTSIAGIFGSLILTFVNTLFPIMANRRQIHRKVSDAIEHLWLFLQDGRDEHQMALYLPRIAKSLENIDQKVLSPYEEEDDVEENEMPVAEAI